MSLTVRPRRFLAALGLVSLVGACLSAQTADKNAQAAPKKNPLLKLVQAWPSAEQLKQRKLDAEALPLFTGHDPIVVTLAGDIKAANKDHDPNSAKRYGAEFRFAQPDGKIDVVPVKLGARGHVRRMARTCDFVPLRVEFPKDGLKGTVFEGQNVLKLVVQCNNSGEFEQYLLREYLAYRIFSLLTP